MKFHLGYILGIWAAALAIAAGYISVTGWGQLFAGSAIVVMVVMGILESAKVITTIYLHKYWKRAPKLLKTYLLAGVVITMTLTSVGIYGYLTSAYQETAVKLGVQEGEIKILEGKRDIFADKIEGNKEIITNKQRRIDKLSDLREKQEVRLDSLVAKEYWSNARKTRQEIAQANEEIQKLTRDIDVVVNQNSALADSVSTYEIKILEVKSNSDVAGEIGPLKYIASITGLPMDSVINYIVLIIIFIFDPMAVTLVLASSNVFEIHEKDKKKPRGGSEPDDDDEGKPDNGPNPQAPSPELLIKPIDKTDITSPSKPIGIPKDFKPPITGGQAVWDEEDFNGSYTSFEGIDDEVIEELVEPEPTEASNELPEDNAPIEEELVPSTEWEERKKEKDTIRVIIDEEKSDNQKAFEVMIDSGLKEEEVQEEEVIIEKVKQDIPEGKEEFTPKSGGFKPEEVIIENKKEIESLTEKREPVIPTGTIEREDIKEIKQGTRGYSVNVPNPNSSIERIGSNKEIRNGDQNNIIYKREK